MTENKLYDERLMREKLSVCIKNNEIEMKPIVDALIEVERNIKRISIPITISEVKSHDEVAKLNKLIYKRDELHNQLTSKISGLTKEIFRLCEIDS